MPHVAALDGEQEMGALEQVAQLIREAREDLAADLDRMDTIDELRARKAAFLEEAEEHERMVAEGGSDAAVHAILARGLRQKASVAQMSIDHVMHAARITQALVDEHDLAQRAIQHETPMQYWCRAARSLHHCGYPSPITINETAYCLDAPEFVPAGSCEHAADEREALTAREVA
jgi:hypothetical protein